jgi:hypothetical protein
VGPLGAALLPGAGPSGVPLVESVLSAMRPQGGGAAVVGAQRVAPARPEGPGSPNTVNVGGPGAEIWEGVLRALKPSPEGAVLPWAITDPAKRKKFFSKTARDALP